MRVARIAIVLTALFWLWLLIEQAVWLSHALQPRFTQDPQIGAATTRYVIASSIKLLLFAVAAFALALFVARSHYAWPAPAFCVLFAFAFWHYFVAGWPLFFRPPFGDGSLHGAVLGYLHFHAAGLWLQVAKLFLLVSCFTLWAIASYYLLRASHQEV